MIAMVVLTRAWLMHSMFLATLSHVSQIVVVMVAYDGIVTLAYIIQSVSSLQAHKDRSSLSRRLSSTLYVTLTSLEYF